MLIKCYYNLHVKYMSKQIIVLVCILGLTLSLFSDDSTVVKLTAKNFKNEVVNSD